MTRTSVLIWIVAAVLVAGTIAIVLDSPESNVTEPDQTTTTTTTTQPVEAILIPPVTEPPQVQQPVQAPDTVPEVELLAPAVIEPEPVAEPEPVTNGVADEAYWDRMAQCETGGNWQHFPYGTWTGGLGIYNQTWLGWGGGEFAPTAGQATKEQQIIVADRIAADVGYSAWGCVTAVGYP